MVSHFDSIFDSLIVQYPMLIDQNHKQYHSRCNSNKCRSELLLKYNELSPNRISSIDLYRKIRNYRSKYKRGSLPPLLSPLPVFEKVVAQSSAPNYCQETELFREQSLPSCCSCRCKCKESGPAKKSSHNKLKSTNFPRCDECKRPVDARELYRCVQCPLVVMCADCGRSNAHVHHCVLRMPSLQIYKKVKHLFGLLTEVFRKNVREKNKNNDVDNHDDVDDDSEDDDDIHEEMEQELNISVHQTDGIGHNHTADLAIPGRSQQHNSTTSTFLSSWSDKPSAIADSCHPPEPPDEAVPTCQFQQEPFHFKLEPVNDPNTHKYNDALSCLPLFYIAQKPTDEPEPMTLRTMTENAQETDYAAESNTVQIGENIKVEDQEEVRVKLEPLNTDATFVDMATYSAYGSHRAGNTDL